MNEKIQRRQIVRFLKRRKSRQVDEFCLYQWLDRCYYQEWWELGTQLASYIVAGSLTPEYQKRISFLTVELRNELNDRYVEIQNPIDNKSFWIPRIFDTACEKSGLSISGSSSRWYVVNRQTDRIILIGKTRSNGCSFRISKSDKDAFLGMLKENGYGYLESSLVSKRDSGSPAYWQKISWDEASSLIPLWITHSISSLAVKRLALKVCKKDYRAFWKVLLEKIKINLPGTTQKSPPNQSYLSIPSGHHHVHFEWYFRKSRKVFCVSIHFEYPDVNRNRHLFDYFYSRRDEIEKIIPEDQFIYEREWGRRWAQIIIQRQSIALDEENVKWGVNKMTHFYKTLKPILDDYFMK